MQYKTLESKSSEPIFRNSDLNFFKKQQMKNSYLLTKLPLPQTRKIQIERFLMDAESTNTTGNNDTSTYNDDSIDTNTYTVLQENEKIDDINEEENNPNSQFNVDKMMKLNKTYDAYKGSEIKNNNPPIAPYPFGPKS